MTKSADIASTDAAYIRLLDMLAGWESFSRSQLETHDTELGIMGLDRSSLESVADHIHDLYQDVGAWETYTEIQIENFILNNVMSIVLKGKFDE